MTVSVLWRHRALLILGPAAGAAGPIGMHFAACALRCRCRVHFCFLLPGGCEAQRAAPAPGCQQGLWVRAVRLTRLAPLWQQPPVRPVAAKAAQYTLLWCVMGACEMKSTTCPRQASSSNEEYAEALPWQ
jgi:hypothetical protein